VFNYSNFRLWKDLRDHWQEMTEISAAFRHLVHTPNQPFAAEPVAENERVSPYCPFSADDSQIEAIQWALDGKSFRLEGPPGTGKTQTIANLLSSCLAHDRRVLFVAEKQIALEAVMNKLEARGLAGFCLNLHTDGDSDAKIRAKIKDQIEEALGQKVDPQTVAWDDLTAKSNQLEKELDDYRDGIHTPNGSGHSLWSAQEATLELGEGPAAPIPASLLDTWNQLWPRLRDAASELEHALSVNGPLNKTPWRLVDRPVDEAARSRIRTALLELVHASQDFARLAQAEPSLTSITQPAELAATANIVSLAADGWTATSPNVLTLASASAWKAAADLAVKQLDELIASATQLKTCFSEDVLERLDIAAASAAHAVVVKARWPTRKRKLEAFRVLLGPLLLGDVEAAVSLFPSLITTGSAAAAWRERAAKQLGLLAPPLVGPLRSDATLRFKQALESVSRASTHGQSVSVTWAAEFLNDGRASDAVTVGILHRASMTWHEFVAATMATAKSWSAWANGKTLLQLAESHVAEAANDTTEHRQLRLQRWSNVLVHLEVLRDAGLIVTRDSLLSGELEPSELINAMRRGIVRSTTLERLLAADLDNFDGVMHDRKIQRFAATQSGIRDLLRQRIPGLVIARKQRMALPSGRKVGELQDLLRDLRPRRGRRTPIRDVLEKYGKSLTRLMPVFLMSPDSVATLLPVGAVDFDLVVFDEASQIRVAHAVGALGRGKASVVVGDSKQMPPSTAFMSTETVTEEDSDDSIATTDSQLEEATVSETDESVLNPLENESVEDEDLADEIALNKAESAPDAESILSEFEEAGFPFLQLLCHFRSKDELLIAFSNSEIYEKPMLTFPSPHIAEAGRGNAALRLIQLDGQYERRKGARIENFRNSGETLAMTRTNLVEADAVVAEIRKRIQDPTETERWLKDTQDGHAGSILVVTFNLPQCELILKLLEIAEKETPGLLSHPTAGSYLEKRKITSKTGDVTLIPRVRIQNLEMVQGGEAETVIFSVAFTKEAGSGSNKVPNRFGPISGHNGYRRLNVAATRAQRELIVFCSFDPDTDLIIDETAEPTYGPLLLKKFLLLAKHGQDAYGGVGVALQRSRHLAEIAEFVKSAGFEARMSLGLSLMQVDVAVRDKDARQWQSAILLDGPLWRDRGSAMQRELLPPDALRSLGWQRVIRVWLVDWIQHRADAQRRLVEQLRGKELPAKPEVETAPPRVPEPRDAPSSPPVGGAISAKQVVFSPFVPRVLGTRQRLEQLRDPKVREQMGALFKSILSAEAPIEVHRFTRLVALSFGLERLREQRHKDLLAMVNPKLIEQTELGDFIWLTSRHAAGYVTYRRSSTEQRDLAEVSTVELMNALEDVLLMAGSLTKDEAIREAAVMFGVERLTAGVRQHLEKLVDITVAEARVRVADGRLFPVSTSA
jgi:hypothetical protein